MQQELTCQNKPFSPEKSPSSAPVRLKHWKGAHNIRSSINSMDAFLFSSSYLEFRQQFPLAYQFFKRQNLETKIFGIWQCFLTYPAALKIHAVNLEFEQSVS